MKLFRALFEQVPVPPHLCPGSTLYMHISRWRKPLLSVAGNDVLPACAAEWPPSSTSSGVTPGCLPFANQPSSLCQAYHLPSQRLGATSRLYQRPLLLSQQAPASARHLSSCVPSQEPHPINGKWRYMKLLWAPSYPWDYLSPWQFLIMFCGSWTSQETFAMWKLHRLCNTFSCDALPERGRSVWETSIVAGGKWRNVFWITTVIEENRKRNLKGKTENTNFVS